MKFRHNEHGFTLVEIMVSVALVSLVGIALMNINSGMIKTQRKMESKSEQFLVHSEIIGILSEPMACKNTFTGLDLLRVTNQNFTAVKDKSNVIHFGINQEIGAGRIKIASMVALAPNASTPNEFMFSINYDLGAAVNPRNVSKQIKIWFEKDGLGAFSNCRSLSNESDIWQRQSGAQNNIEYSGGKIVVDKLQSNTSLTTLDCSDSDNSGLLAYDPSQNIYRFCNGSKLTNLLSFEENTCKDGATLVFRDGKLKCSCGDDEGWDKGKKECVAVKEGTYSATKDYNGCHGEDFTVKILKTLNSFKTGYIYDITVTQKADYTWKTSYANITSGQSFLFTYAKGRDSQAMKVETSHYLDDKVVIKSNDCKGSGVYERYSIYNVDFI